MIEIKYISGHLIVIDNKLGTINHICSILLHLKANYQDNPEAFLINFFNNNNIKSIYYNFDEISDINLQFKGYQIKLLQKNNIKSAQILYNNFPLGFIQSLRIKLFSNNNVGNLNLNIATFPLDIVENENFYKNYNIMIPEIKTSPKIDKLFIKNKKLSKFEIM